jgi:hypothetical protein
MRRRGPALADRMRDESFSLTYRSSVSLACGQPRRDFQFGHESNDRPAKTIYDRDASSREQAPARLTKKLGMK